MRIIRILLFFTLAIGLHISCSAQTKKDNKVNKASKASTVEVYYFHYTRRCATCNAVEKVSKETVAEFPGNKVTFADFNLDKQEGKAKGKELGVSVQTLLIVAGDKKINITNEGFMNARSNPEKLKAVIKEKIEPLL